jgi:hypothetical protein
MLSNLSEYIEEESASGYIKDKQLLDECLTFRKQRNGKYEADGRCHDDSVMKWAVCNMMRLEKRVKPRIIIMEADDD